ncbi:hypothetical protein BUALT_Bualt06G0043600 [Buddleja alternifolia]|uniref:Uncharacterized protein n=1 Tax=Buddleja alternifolia TaxID=168488 RepID=A0AAV6XKM1_9LAMI|nr:hypothetical protein BUALT_Bualt06G0043600 [Buddleja alternifolia]
MKAMIETGKLKMIFAKSLGKIFKKQKYGILGQLFFVTLKPITTELLNEDLNTLLTSFSDIFSEPTNLPLDRILEHQITLLPHSIPKKQFPYTSVTARTPSPQLPSINEEGQTQIYPTAILAHRIIPRNNRPVTQMLVQWVHSRPEFATREDLAYLLSKFHNSILADKNHFHRGIPDQNRQSYSKRHRSINVLAQEEDATYHTHAISTASRRTHTSRGSASNLKAPIASFSTTKCSSPAEEEPTINRHLDN